MKSYLLERRRSLLQTILFEPESDWTPPEVLPDFENCEAISIDLETNDPGLTSSGAGWATRKGHVAGIAVGFKRGEDYDTRYLPIAHQMTGNVDKGWVLRWLKKLCACNKPKVFHNSMYDIGWLTTEDIEVHGPIYDTQFAAALLDENRVSYSLDNVALDWIGLGKDEALLMEAAAAYGFKTPKAAKANLWRLPPRHVGPYAEGDALATLKLWHYVRSRLEREDLMELMQLEMDLVPLLIKMRQRGIRVDTDRAEQVRKDVITKQKNIHKNIKSEYGVTVDVWANASLAKAFDSCGLEYSRTAKGAPSFTKEFLGAHEHPLPQKILEIRKLEKTVNTFIDGMILGHGGQGRIHCELHPLKSDDGGTVSGRFSCSNPNLQQTSARDPELGPLIRGMFVPELDHKWFALDYSSQEPRLTVHYAALTNQEGAAEAVEMFRKDPRTDYHQMVADIADISRKHAKTINLGLAYGMGQVKLCESLGLPTEFKTLRNGDQIPVAGEDGLRIMKAYNERVPFVKGLTETSANLAQERGWIKTLFNRRCRFDHWEPTGAWKPAILTKAAAEKKYGLPLRRAYTHKALNRLIQGSAADMTKLAMREMYKEGVVPMLQMHDELDISTDDPAIIKRCIEIMEHCVELQVPIVVDAEVGDTWGSANTEFLER